MIALLGDFVVTISRFLGNNMNISFFIQMWWKCIYCICDLSGCLCPGNCTIAKCKLLILLLPCPLLVGYHGFR